MSGWIAYQADKVGKMLGKKRLSFFGLRPRHTAALGTVLVGVSTSIFTIAAVMMVSSGVREWVLKGPQVAKKLDEALSRLDDLRKEANSTAVSNKSLTAKNANITHTLTLRQHDLANAQRNLALLQTQINALQPKIHSLTADVKNGRSKIQQLKSSELNLLAAKRQVEINLQKVRQDETRAKANLAVVAKDNSGIASKNLQLTQRNDELADTLKSLKTEQTRLTAEIARIEKDTNALESARDATQLELTASQAKLHDAQGLLTSAQAELANTEQLLKNSKLFGTTWQAISNVSRRQPMIYRIGEEVARIPVRAKLTNAGAVSELTTLLRRSRVEAQKRGAHSTADFPDAGIFNHTSQAGQTVTTSDIEKQVISELTGSSVPMVLIASSSLNAFKGEPVSLEISVIPNPVVYANGQLIVEGLIDANKGDAVISEQFSKFLQEVVKERALKDGMIPIANSDTSLGEVTLPQALQIIEQLKRADRKVRIQAIANGNTRAADTLKLEFRLR